MTVGHVMAPLGLGREMLLGAAVAAGAEMQLVSEVAERLGCRARRGERTVDGLVATHVCIEADPAAERADSMSTVLGLIEGAGLAPEVAQGSIAVYRRLFEAEAGTHGCQPESVRLHQLGEPRYPALIAATVAAVASLRLERLTVGPIALGRGWIAAGGHGMLPVPAPVTSVLLEGYHVVGGPLDGELTGPTAAALASTLARAVPGVPPMRLVRQGRGAGRLETVPGYATLLVGDA